MVSSDRNAKYVSLSGTPVWKSNQEGHQFPWGIPLKKGDDICKNDGLWIYGKLPWVVISYHTTFRHLQAMCRNANRELKPCSSHAQQLWRRAGHRKKRQAHHAGGSPEVLSKQSILQPSSSGHRKPTGHNKCNYPQEKCCAWNKHPLAPLLAKPDRFVPCKCHYSEQVSEPETLSTSSAPFTPGCQGRTHKPFIQLK